MQRFQWAARNVRVKGDGASAPLRRTARAGPLGGVEDELGDLGGLAAARGAAEDQEGARSEGLQDRCLVVVDAARPPGPKGMVYNENNQDTFVFFEQKPGGVLTSTAMQGAGGKNVVLGLAGYLAGED